MSGGHFEYMQYRIREIADTLDKDINGRELDEDDIKVIKRDCERGWIDKKYYEYCKEHMHTPPCNGFEPRTIEQFNQGYVFLRLAEIYAQRIDWLMSDEDDEETFHERLMEDIDELVKEFEAKDKLIRLLREQEIVKKKEG